MINRFNLALVVPDLNAYSETFIKAHIDYLQPKMVFNYGRIPQKSGDDLIQSPWIRALRSLMGKLKRDATYKDRTAFKRALRTNKIDVVFIEYGTQAVEIAPILYELRIPFIVHFHGFDASVESVLRKNKEPYKYIFERAFRIISVSCEMTNDLIKIGCDEKKIVHNPYGPSKDYFLVNPDYSSKRLVSVGRFVDKKAPYYLILAFQKIVSEFPDAEMVMIGDGPLKNACSNLINYYDLKDKISLVGIKRPEKIMEYFAHSSVFVQHSIRAENGDKEGSPVAIMEAGAAALPVVATKHAGITESVVDGETGYLVDEHEVKEFAEKLKLLLADVKKRKRMGLKGRKHIASSFTLESHIEKLKICLLQAFEHSKLENRS